MNQVFLTIDNAKIHTSEVILGLLKHLKFEVLFTPPYSPEVHFIELVFC